MPATRSVAGTTGLTDSSGRISTGIAGSSGIEEVKSVCTPHSENAGKATSPASTSPAGIEEVTTAAAAQSSYEPLLPLSMGHPSVRAIEHLEPASEGCQVIETKQEVLKSPATEGCQAIKRKPGPSQEVFKAVVSRRKDKHRKVLPEAENANMAVCSWVLIEMPPSTKHYDEEPSIEGMDDPFLANTVCAVQPQGGDEQQGGEVPEEAPETPAFAFVAANQGQVGQAPGTLPGIPAFSDSQHPALDGEVEEDIGWIDYGGSIGYAAVLARPDVAKTHVNHLLAFHSRRVWDIGKWIWWITRWRWKVTMSGFSSLLFLM